MTSENFLPEYKLPKTQTRGRSTFQCVKRDKAVPATPEEEVRQRILRWLVEDRKWPVQKIELERSYAWVGDQDRHRIRPDIELLDDDNAILVVVECKAEQVPLGPAVEKQALEYAIKSESKYIWISNGRQHRFLKRHSSGRYRSTESLEPLQASYAPPAVNFDFPDVTDDQAIDVYFESSFSDEAYTTLEYNDKRIVLSMHKLLFDMEKKLPFSFGGVHVLEDRGADYHQFGNAGGGKWGGLYADFIAATSGRVEALSVAASTWGGESGGIRLCVGVRKAGRHHHALQMDFGHSEWIEARRCWEIYHDGRMANISNDTVLEAVKESGAGDWLEKKPGLIYLGDLHWVETACWENSKAFLANVLHYGIIRTNLRDAHQARKKKNAARQRG